MTTFTLDTSGEVVLTEPVSTGGGIARVGGAVYFGVVRWSDLDPFTQGYAAEPFNGVAIWRSTDRDGPPPQLVKVGPRLPDWDDWAANPAPFKITLASGEETEAFEDELTPVSFSNLAPETLAMMLRDCAAIRGLNLWYGEGDADRGVVFWERRQNGDFPRFPPLTPYFGDDGKVYLLEGTS